MKKVIAVMLLLAGAVCAQKDEEVSVEFVTLGRNVSVRSVPEKDQLSFGFRAGYVHYFGRKSGRGDIGIGFESGATFHSVGESRLAIVRGQYLVKYQANGNKKFQPFVKGTVGIACDHWNKKGVNSPGNTGCPALTYGGGVGIDKPFKEGSRKKFRFAVEYYRSNFRNPVNGFRRESQNNVEVSAGIVF